MYSYIYINDESVEKTFREKYDCEGNEAAYISSKYKKIFTPKETRINRNYGCE